MASWRGHMERHGIEGGVIVQVSFLGTDNGELLKTLSRLDRRRFAGVAVTPVDVDPRELERLHGAGVRALRWNLVAGTEIPDLHSPQVRAFAAKLAEAGIHLELQLESSRLAPILPDLAALDIPVVIDHCGLPENLDARGEPWLNALEKLAERETIYVKLSAPYRGIADPRGHIDRLLTLLPADRFVWGSDWPHTRHEARADYPGLLPNLSTRIDDVAAAGALYGFETQ
jgi:predicted TIM-barrel fold metal-dependent hydrolase